MRWTRPAHVCVCASAPSPGSDQQVLSSLRSQRPQGIAAKLQVGIGRFGQFLFLGNSHAASPAHMARQLASTNPAAVPACRVPSFAYGSRSLSRWKTFNSHTRPTWAPNSSQSALSCSSCRQQDSRVRCRMLQRAVPVLPSSPPASTARPVVPVTLTRLYATVRC